MTHWTVKSGRKRKDNCITVVLCVLQHYFVSNKWKKLYIFRHRFAGKMETFESILLIKQEVFVYKIPPAGNNRKHRWAFSMASEKQKTTIGFYLSKFAMSEFFFAFDTICTKTRRRPQKIMFSFLQSGKLESRWTTVDWPNEGDCQRHCRQSEAGRQEHGHIVRQLPNRKLSRYDCNRIGDHEKNFMDDLRKLLANACVLFTWVSLLFVLQELPLKLWVIVLDILLFVWSMITVCGYFQPILFRKILNFRKNNLYSMCSGRSANLGLGFGDRSDSFDLNVALQDHFKWVKNQEKIEQDNQAPKQEMNLGFKEGETIKINMKITVSICNRCLRCVWCVWCAPMNECVIR